MFLVLLFLLSPAYSHAISELGYTEQLQSRVIPYVQAHLRRGHFLGKGNVPIQFGTLRAGSLGTVVLVPGRTEWIGTHLEQVYDFASKGYSVAVLDHRGQGNSGRLVTQTDVGHVENFSDYTDDFESFLSKIVLGKLPPPYYLLADSMGGAISLLYLEKHSFQFAAVALAAPMIKVNTGLIPEPIAFALTQLLKSVGLGTMYAPTTSAYDFKARFEENTFTHSSPRFRADMDRVISQPETAMGGPSVNWLFEALSVGHRLPEAATHIRDPLLIFAAGEDHFVDSNAQKTFCEAAPNCSFVAYPGAFHSLLLERDSVRDDLLVRAIAHFKDHMPAAPARVAKGQR